MNMYPLYIDNEWRAASDSKTFLSYNKATGQILHRFSEASLEDVDDACKSARSAFRAWADLSGGKRADYLLRVAEIMKRRQREMAEYESMETGKPIKESFGFDIRVSIWAFEYFAALGREIKGDVIPLVEGGDCDPNDFDFVTYEPYGLAAIIAPYNFPLHLLTRSLAPALAAGNTCVIKASSTTPTTAAIMGEIFEEAGLPKGVVNVIHGAGAVVGNALVAHPEVDIIGFTGSETVGRELLHISADSPVIKKCVLELGGKGPVIVEADADLELAATAQVSGFTFNQGAVCCAMTRLILHEDVYDDYLALLKSKVEKIVIGDPLDEASDMGCLISEKQLQKIQAYVEEAVSMGAKIYCGGTRCTQAACHQGAYYLPTILVNIRPDMPVWREEVFGPVLSVMKYKDTGQAIALANDSNFGLGSNIFTENLKKAYRMSKLLNAGLVWVNMGNGMHMAAPFGGNKNSGMGREYGTYGIHEYLKIKNNMWRMS